MFRQLNSINKSLIAALITVCLSTLALAQKAAEEQIKLPETAAGKTLGEFIKVLNSGDLEKMRRFHSDRGGDPENAQQDKGFYDQSGGVNLHSVKRSEEFEIEVLAQTKNDGNWLSLTISVEQQAPYAITQIHGQPAEAPREKSKP